MVHLTEDDLASLLFAARRDREQEHRAYAHLAVCAACARRLGELRAADREAAGLLRTLDTPAPIKDAVTIMRLALTPERRIPFGGGRAAAVLAFLAVAAAAAAAYPASPLHRFLVGKFSNARSSQLAPAARTTTTPVVSVEPGVSFVAAPGASLDIDFEGQQAGGVLELRVIERSQVSLSSLSPGSTYRVSSNRIVVFQTIPGRFRLEIPRSLEQVRVRVGTDIIFERGAGKNLGADAFTIKLTRPK
ncbi:MAG TPA: hypothetical protein VJS39_05840 [Gemmatimonadaceae bacterium]|nr:hypothetical protein [Gemmatimonadaceae bacterium]